MSRFVYPDDAVIMAPIAGHSDLPMRLSARRHGCRFAFTEMIDAGSLVFSPQRNTQMLNRHDSETFLGIQLVGSDEDHLLKAVDLINTMNFDVLDFNLGCPAPKVAKKGEGITLALKNPDKAVHLVEHMVRRSRIPVSVKTRILNETDPDATVEFCKRLESTGISALTLHGRIMKVFYSGPVFYSIIKAVRESLKIQVIANGGAMTRESYETLLRETGCTNGMIARGCMGNPWIFDSIQTNRVPPTMKEFADELELHVRSMLEYYGEDLALRLCRKTILEYLRGRGFPSTLRASVSYLNSVPGFDMFLYEVRRGPSWRFWEFQELHPDEVERKMTPPDDRSVYPQSDAYPQK